MRGEISSRPQRAMGRRFSSRSCEAFGEAEVIEQRARNGAEVSLRRPILFRPDRNL